tara:strand:+ start:3645 stop:4799 length:1155 start_codon:yes stop_codon:yes gene_type:complete
MKILILGADGYLGWPTSMYFSDLGHDVYALDNFSKRKIELEFGVNSLSQNYNIIQRIDEWNKNIKNKIKFFNCDLLNHRNLYSILEEVKPEAIIHYAEQPSAPYSMHTRETAVFTQQNNVIGNLNLLFGIKKFCPNAHLIKLGTMGEYGTPNIDIEEGWLDITHNGRKERILYPKKPGSFYHLSKVHDSNNIEFATRNWKIRCTDLNQGVVYGVETDQTKKNEKYFGTSFHYDDIFGTVINRFIAQAVKKRNLTVYGSGDQQRAFLNIMDTLNCVRISAENPPKEGEFRVFNQFTEGFSIDQLADIVVKAAKKNNINISKEKISNPRTETENHYYNPKNESLLKLGLKPILFTEDLASSMIKKIQNFSGDISEKFFKPKIKWNK